MSKRSGVKIESADFCEETSVDRAKLAGIRLTYEQHSVLYSVAELFKALGDLTRIKILHALTFNELCVCEIAELVGMTQSAVSHQLRILRMARLVKFRKSGKRAFYMLDDEHVRTLLEQSLSHAKEKKA